MALIISNYLVKFFDQLECPVAPIDEFSVASQLEMSLPKLEDIPNLERKAIFAEGLAFRFRGDEDRSSGRWGIYWQEMMSGQLTSGEEILTPDIKTIDEEILEYWKTRAYVTKHPVLVARYADLSWEIGKYHNRKNKIKSGVSDKCISKDLCITAIDAYLEGLKRNLFENEFTAWIRFDRALDLALSIKDANRIDLVKQSIYNFCEERVKLASKWSWSKFDQLFWKHSKTLQLNTYDKEFVIGILENILSISSNQLFPEFFDPHVATLAADKLQRWRSQLNQRDEAKRAIRTAGKAFEDAAQKSSAMLAIAWLEDLIPRYREAAMLEDALRVEQLIHERSKEAENGFNIFETSIKITQDEMDGWVLRFIKDTPSNSLNLIAVYFLAREEETKDFLLKSQEDFPIMAYMPISLKNNYGMTIATIGSIESDIEGRCIHQASTSFGLNGIWLNLVFDRVCDHFHLNATTTLELFHNTQLFPTEKIPFLHAGITAWFENDDIKCIHILVPQIESALRELLRCLGGSIIEPDREVNGFKFITLGKILHHKLFKDNIPRDIIFHLTALYNDSRGINLRNEIAHELSEKSY